MASLTTRVVEGLYEDWNRNRLDAVLERATPDIIWSTPGGASAYPDAFGYTETRGKLQAVAGVWTGWRVEVHRMIRLDQTVLVTGVHAHEAGGSVAFRHLWDLRDEQVCRFREQIDSTALLHVLAGAA